MNFKDLPLKNEIKEGLLKYGKDNNAQPFNIIESLVEEFLYKNKYLVVGVGDKEVPFPQELNKPHISFVEKNHGKYRVRRRINGYRYNFASCDYEEARLIVEFLESKNWDLKYSTKESGLNGREQVEFLLGEIEKG